jgi:hypothetical protein
MIKSNFSFMLHITFISEAHHVYVWVTGLLLFIHSKVKNFIKCLLLKMNPLEHNQVNYFICDIICEYYNIGIFIVRVGYGAESFLARCIPYL